MTATILVCPRCSEAESFETIERLYGFATIAGPITLSAAGSHYEHSGDAQEDWDSAVTVGVRCRACAWSHEGSGWSDALTRSAPRDDEWPETADEVLA